MKRLSNEEIINKLIGLGEQSTHKTYYPELMKQLEEQKQTRALLDSMINSIPLMLISIDEYQQILTLNKEGIKFAQKNDSQEIIGHIITDIFPLLSAYQSKISDVIQTNIPVIIERMNDQSGRLYNMLVTPLIGEKIPGAVIRLEDITEFEKKEQQLRQAQRMESVGILSGGIAHDFNNMLGGIMGAVSVLKSKLSVGELTPDLLNYLLDLIEESGVRAGEIVQQLFSLSEKKQNTFIPVDLKAIIKHITKFAKNSLDKSVKLSLQTPQEDTMIFGDPVQLEQILLNLTINATHAMTIMRSSGESWGGDLKLIVKKIPYDGSLEKIYPEAKSIDYWMLMVKDEGIGMNQKTVDQIFTPFFTTKDKGVGTGLGLSMVYTIVQKHHGFIAVYSEKGVGTVFNLYFPCHEVEDQGDVVSDSRESLGTQSGTILVIDDENLVRITAQMMLEECGYQIYSAESGEKGIALYEHYHQEIDGVLLDMAMPELSGKDVFKRLIEINPDVKVILASGFKHDRRIKEALELGVKQFIEKPYTLQKLSETVHNVLSE